MTIEIYSYGITHKGLVRLENEDVWTHLPKEHFYLVADGMGGRNAGEVAAFETVSILSQKIKQNPIFKNPSANDKLVKEALSQAIQETNHAVWELSQKDSALDGMGTTLCCIYFLPGSCIYANVGDSRIYRWRKGHLEQLTQDDSLVGDLLYFGLVNEKEAQSFPLKHVITKSVGTVAEVEPEVEALPYNSGDLFLLCTDGLSNLVAKQEMEKIISEMESVCSGAERLLQAALDAGGLDNITLILLQVV